MCLYHSKRTFYRITVLKCCIYLPYGMIEDELNGSSFYQSLDLSAISSSLTSKFILCCITLQTLHSKVHNKRLTDACVFYKLIKIILKKQNDNTNSQKN